VPRPTPDEIQANYAIEEALRNPAPQVIGLFDDVLTTGAHYRAASSALKQAFPDVRVIGFFIARRVPKAVDLEDFELQPAPLFDCSDVPWPHRAVVINRCRWQSRGSG
jgi:orotate phosphoribosyltransferase